MGYLQKVSESATLYSIQSNLKSGHQEASPFSLSFLCLPALLLGVYPYALYLVASKMSILLDPTIPVFP